MATGGVGRAGLNVSDRGALGLLKQPRRYSVAGNCLCFAKMCRRWCWKFPATLFDTVILPEKANDGGGPD
jgi:hypothetical protein